MLSLRVRRMLWGIYILIALWVMVLLPMAQSYALNTHGNARFLGMNLAHQIMFVMRVSKNVARALGWHQLVHLYYSDNGPLARDPMTHSAWPYWGAAWAIWGLGLFWVLVVFFSSLWFVRTFFFAGVGAAKPQPPPATVLGLTASSTTMAGLWSAIPFLWPRVNLAGYSYYEQDKFTGEHLIQRAVAATGAAVFFAWLGVPRGVTSILTLLAAGFCLLAILSFREGKQLTNQARIDERADAAHQRDLDERLLFLEAQRQTPKRDLEHQITVLTLQQNHERRLKNLDRLHQRLLLEHRQPHELQLKSFDLTLALAQLVAVAKSENAYDKFQAIFDRLDKKQQVMEQDIRNRNLSDDEKEARIEALRADLAALSQQLVRQL